MKRNLTCTNFIIILEKDFQKKTPKIPNTNALARRELIFSAVRCHPTESQVAIHIYYVNYENAAICKRSKEDNVLK